MSQTTQQALERYTSLQQDLISSLDTTTLETIQEESLKMARGIRSEALKSRCRLGVFILLIGILTYNTGGMYDFLIGLAAVLVWLHWHWGATVYDLRFALSGGQTFSVTEACSKPENSSQIRLWREAQTGVHGRVSVRAFRVKAGERRRVEMLELGATEYFVQMYGLKLLRPYVYYRVIDYFLAISSIFIAKKNLLLQHDFFHGQKSFTFFMGSFSGSGFSTAAVGIVFILQYMRFKVGAEPLDANSISIRHCYQTVIQVLDSRGASQGSRRLPTR